MTNLKLSALITNLELHFPPAVRYSNRCAFDDFGKGSHATMTTAPAGIERRVGQRFPYLLPLSLRQPDSSLEGVGFTQDLSSRGVFFFTDAPLREGAEIELTLRMPSEITLGENMPVRCRGRVLRIIRPAATSPHDASASARAETKIGVAVRFAGYEYLPESTESSSTFARVSTQHSHHDSHHDASHDEDRPLAHSSGRSILG
jgi:hypothetical protein